MLIGWTPVCRMLRHFNIGTIRIPIGDFFKDFKIDSITLESEEIIINLFEKNHCLLENKDALHPRNLWEEQRQSDSGQSSKSPSLF